MEDEKKIFKALLDNEYVKDEISNILKNVVLENQKSAEASVIARTKANALLTQQTEHDAEIHKAIFSLSCESIALAPAKSEELAFAYGNRAYFLLHTKKYEDCIKDIDQALKIPIHDGFKVKLLCRKAKCMKELGIPSEVINSLETAKDLVNKTEHENKFKLLNTIDTYKTLLVNGSGKVKTNGQEIQRSNTNELHVTDDYSSQMTIEYSEKHGRHLVAAKDYKPGDVIFVEKLYASAFENGYSLFTCDWCLKPVWSSIPCNYCNWSMYCSDDCKDKAWNSYHGIECSLISYIKECYDMQWRLLVLPIRVLATAIKETGSVAKLKKELESESQSDGPSKTLLKNDQLGVNSIKNIYTLASYIPYNSLLAMCETVPSILINLIKCDELKGNFNVEQFEDFKTNEDIIYLGSLLVKLIKVIGCNAFYLHCDLFTQDPKISKMVHIDNKQCLSVLYSLLNHSCCPTADLCYTEQNKLLVYAIQPIEKNAQIFVNYGYMFEKDSKSTRQERLQKKYDFVCDCQACNEDWPLFFEDENAFYELLNKDHASYSDDERKCHDEIVKIRLATEEQTDESHVKTLSSRITSGTHWKRPSFVLSLLIRTFKSIFKSIYSPKYLKFDKCN